MAASPSAEKSKKYPNSNMPKGGQTPKDSPKYPKNTPKRHRGKFTPRKNGQNSADAKRKSSNSPAKRESFSQNDVSNPKAMPEPTLKMLNKTPSQEEPTKTPATPSEVKKTEEMNKVATTVSDGGGFAVLLTQGILSGDEEKIESVVKNSDKATIIATVKKLPVVHLIPFLNHIEKRFREGKREQMDVYLTWLRVVLSIHMSYLSSVRDLDRRLGSLGVWMAQRVSHLDRLMALQGKLQLIVDQMQHRSKPNLMAGQEAMLVFQDEDRFGSDLDEFDQEQAHDHDEEWWQDEELDDMDEDMDSDEPETSSKRSKEAVRKRKRDEHMEVDRDENEDEGSGDEDEEEESDEEKGEIQIESPQRPSKNSKQTANKLNGPTTASQMNGRKGVDEDDAYDFDVLNEDEEDSEEENSDEE